MKRVSILYLAIIAILLGVIAVMAYTFLIAGKTVTAEDKRSAIVLEPAERSLVLGEMRGFLLAVQAITEALGDVKHAHTQLSETLKKCVACHALYQITAPATAGR